MCHWRIQSRLWGNWQCGEGAWPPSANEGSFSSSLVILSDPCQMVPLWWSLYQLPQSCYSPNIFSYKNFTCSLENTENIKYKERSILWPHLLLTTSDPYLYCRIHPHIRDYLSMRFTLIRLQTISWGGIICYPHLWLPFPYPTPSPSLAQHPTHGCPPQLI